MLDWDDDERVLPDFAHWRTIRQMAWHIVDTESRYYLPCCGIDYRPPLPDLVEELEASEKHVHDTLVALPADIVSAEHGDWTSVKLLRRLAWHERGELVALRRMMRRAQERMIED